MQKSEMITSILVPNKRRSFFMNGTFQTRKALVLKISIEDLYLVLFNYHRNSQSLQLNQPQVICIQQNGHQFAPWCLQSLVKMETFSSMIYIRARLYLCISQRQAQKRRQSIPWNSIQMSKYSLSPFKPVTVVNLFFFYSSFILKLRRQVHYFF